MKEKAAPTEASAVCTRTAPEGASTPLISRT